MNIDTYTVGIRFEIDKSSLRGISNYLARLRSMSPINLRFDMDAAAMARLLRFSRDLERSTRRAADNLNGFGRIRLSGGSLGSTGIGDGFAINQVKAAVVAAANFEEKMIDVKVALNAVGDGSAEQMGKIQDLAMQIGSTTRFTATQAAEAAEMLVRNGVSADQIINGMLKSTVVTSIAMRSDMQETADVMTDIMAFYRSLGVSAEEASNRFVASTLTSKFGFNDMAYAMARGGSIAAAYGIPLKELSVILAGISPSFKKGAEAGTSFKWFLKSLDGKSAKAKKQIEAMGFDFFENGKIKSMRDVIAELEKGLNGLSTAERNAKINAIFHGYALNSVLAMLNMGVKGYDELAKKQDQVSASDIARQKSMQGLTEAYYKLKSAVEGLYLAIINQDVLDFLSKLTLGITDFINKISGDIPKIYDFLGILKNNLGKAFSGQEPEILEDLEKWRADEAEKQGKPIGFDPDTPKWFQWLSNKARGVLGMESLKVVSQSPMPEGVKVNSTPRTDAVLSKMRNAPITNTTVTINNAPVNNINQSFTNSEPSTVKSATSQGVAQSNVKQQSVIERALGSLLNGS